MKLRFELDIKPEAKQSARFGQGRAYTSKKKEQYVTNLCWLIRKQLTPGFKPIANTAIRITKLDFVFKVPDSAKASVKKEITAGNYYYKATKPDIDNLKKPLLDALSKLVYADDNLVIEIKNARKLYGLKPCIVVELETESENVIFGGKK